MNQVACGFLLRKVALSNDDVLLDFFTDVEGLITISARKLSASKKRVGELDYFRLLEIEYEQKGHKKQLKKITTIRDFNHPDKKSFILFQKKYDFLIELSRILPQEKSDTNFFHQVLEIIDHFEDSAIFDLFVRVKILDFLGVLPPFDHGDKNADFSPAVLTTSEKKFLHFLSHSSMEVFQAERKNFTDIFSPDCEKLLNIISQSFYT